MDPVKKLEALGFTRVGNGGGLHVHAIPVGRGLVLYAGDGEGDEVKPHHQNIYLAVYLENGTPLIQGWIGAKQIPG